MSSVFTLVPMMGIAFKSLIVYICIIAGVRIFGKKELSQLSVVDLVFILLISNSVQNAMVGSDSSLRGGLIAAATLFVVNYSLKFILYKSKKISSWVQGSPVLLVYHGKVLQKHLDQERISMEEIKETMREHGVSKIEEINLAVLEVDGNISILSDNFQKKSKRKRILKRPRKEQ